MLAISKKIDDFKRVVSPEGVRIIFKNTVNSNPKLANEISRAQLNRSEREDGELLPKYRNLAYLRRKRKLPRSGPNNRINLLLSGDFHKSIKTRSSLKKLTFTSRDSKFRELTKRYAGNSSLIVWNEKTKLDFKDTKLFDVFINNFNDAVKS